jgi:hypothetical protein
VRCDMAMLVLNDVFAETWAKHPSAGLGLVKGLPEGRTPNSEAQTPAVPEFWEEAVGVAKRANPDFLFLAEVYWNREERLQSLGIDYTYDKELYDGLVGRDPAGVQRHLLGVTPRLIERSAHFLENHDEPRVASILSLPEHRAAVLVILGLPGMGFLHEGQLTGARIRVPVQFAWCEAESARPEVARMYDEILLHLRKTAVGRGQGEVLRPRAAWAGNPTAQNFVLVQWQAGRLEFDLVVVNLAPHRGQCYAPLSVPDLGAHTWLLEDLLGPEQHRRYGRDLESQGLYLDLPEHGAQLFHFRALRPQKDAEGNRLQPQMDADERR